MIYPPYIYKGKSITIETRQDLEGEWEALATVHDSSGTWGTMLDKWPTPKFQTEQDAIYAAELMAEYRVKHPIVKPIASN